jgi:hypothetical protein
MLNNLRRLIQSKRHWMLTKDVLFLHDNPRPHTAAHTNALIRLFNWKIFNHPPLQSELGAKRLPSVHQDEGLVGYPALPFQQRAYGWSQQQAA